MKKKTICIHKWVFMLVALEKYNKIYSMSRIARKIGITDSWGYLIFKTFEKKGWIKNTKTGRKYKYSFTKKGLSVLRVSKKLILFVDGKDHPLIKKEEEKGDITVSLKR